MDHKAPTRREVLALTIGGSLTACAGSSRSNRADPPPDQPIEQPRVAEPAAFMAAAELLRDRAVSAGDQAYGAVLVRDGKIIGLGPSRVIEQADATAHAEMEAIRDASRRLRSADLSNSVLYSTSRPCRMCEAASSWARVSRMVHGANLTDAGVPNAAC